MLSQVAGDFPFSAKEQVGHFHNQNDKMWKGLQWAALSYVRASWWASCHYTFFFCKNVILNFLVPKLKHITEKRNLAHTLACHHWHVVPMRRWQVGQTFYRAAWSQTEASKALLLNWSVCFSFNLQQYHLHQSMVSRCFDYVHWQLILWSPKYYKHWRWIDQVLHMPWWVERQLFPVFAIALVAVQALIRKTIKLASQRKLIESWFNSMLSNLA